MPEWLVGLLLLTVSNLIVAVIWTLAIVALLGTRKDTKRDIEIEYMEHRMEYDDVFARQQKEIIRVNQEVANGLRLVGVAMQVSEMRKAKEDVEHE